MKQTELLYIGNQSQGGLIDGVEQLLTNVRNTPGVLEADTTKIDGEVYLSVTYEIDSDRSEGKASRMIVGSCIHDLKNRKNL